MQHRRQPSRPPSARLNLPPCIYLAKELLKFRDEARRRTSPLRYKYLDDVLVSGTAASVHARPLGLQSLQISELPTCECRKFSRPAHHPGINCNHLKNSRHSLEVGSDSVAIHDSYARHGVTTVNRTGNLGRRRCDFSDLSLALATVAARES